MRLALDRNATSVVNRDAHHDGAARERESLKRSRLLPSGLAQLTSEE
jgi:hypothetical protein